MVRAPVSGRKFGPAAAGRNYSFFVVLAWGTRYSFSFITATLLPVVFSGSKSAFAIVYRSQ
jgi:hypothetical protein